VISTNASLDGVVQDPDGEEGFGRGGWFGQFGGKDLEEWAKVELEEALRTDALLLGRRSDEWFATRWSSRTGEWADRLNSLPNRTLGSCHSVCGVVWASGMSSMWIGCRQMEQRPVQHLKSGCRSSTAFGSVRPAAGDLGAVAPGSGSRARR
jgi:hypothetical protein